MRATHGMELWVCTTHERGCAMPRRPLMRLQRSSIIAVGHHVVDQRREFPKIHLRVIACVLGKNTVRIQPNRCRDVVAHLSDRRDKLVMIDEPTPIGVNMVKDTHDIWRALLFQLAELVHAVRVGGVIEQLVNLQNLPQAAALPHS